MLIQLRILLLGPIVFPKQTVKRRETWELIYLYAINLSRYTHPKFVYIVFNLRSVYLFQFLGQCTQVKFIVFHPYSPLDLCVLLINCERGRGLFNLYIIMKMFWKLAERLKDASLRN